VLCRRAPGYADFSREVEALIANGENGENAVIEFKQRAVYGHDRDHFASELP
jgi:hypothetical protein